MMNYGLDGNQQEALETALACMYAQIITLEMRVQRNQEQIAGEPERVARLEKGEFLKRYTRMINEDKRTIQKTREAIKELQNMLGVPGVTENI